MLISHKWHLVKNPSSRKFKEQKKSGHIFRPRKISVRRLRRPCFKRGIKVDTLTYLATVMTRMHKNKGCVKLEIIKLYSTLSQDAVALVALTMLRRKYLGFDVRSIFATEKNTFTHNLTTGLS